MDFDSQAKILEQRKNRYLQQQNAQAPDGQMVNGRYVAANPLEYLAAGLRGYGGMRGEQLANQELTDLQAKKKEAMQGDMSAMLAALRGKPAETVQPLTPNDDEGNVNAPIQMPSQAGSIDRFYEIASKSQFPQFQQMGMQGAITSAQQQAQKAQEDQTRRVYIAALNQYGPAEAVRMGLVPSNIATEFANAKNIGRDEVSKQIEIEGPNGEKLIQNIDKFGQPVGAPTPAYTAPVQVNSGGAVQFVKPTAGKAIPITMSPKDKDESARGWAGVNNARERLSMDKTKAQTETANGGYSSKPLPAAALKMQNEAVDAANTASGINAGLDKVSEQISSGKLSFGPVSNTVNSARNLLGKSTEESRNFSSFKSTLERLRNESLRLNTGVQTDGDAQRAWNELFENINDTELVKQRLSEITAINKRAEQLQRLKVDQIRGNYNAPPLDFGSAAKPPAASAFPDANAIAAEIARRKGGK